MELIIVLAIVGIIVAYLVMQRRKDLTGESQPAKDWPTEPTEPAAPYKVETTAPQVEEAAVVATPVKEVIPEAVVEAVVEVSEVVVEAEPAKKPRKARVAKPKAEVEKVVETTTKGSKRTRSKKV